MQFVKPFQLPQWMQFATKIIVFTDPVSNVQFFFLVFLLSQSVAEISHTGKIKGVSAAQSEQLHWGWKKAEPYVFFKSQSLPLVYWLRGLIGMYICINTAISDPLCVCACVWPGEARRALPDWFTKGKGCFTLVTGSWRATKKKKKPEGWRVGLNTHPDRARAPSRRKALTPLSSWLPLSSPSHSHKPTNTPQGLGLTQGRTTIGANVPPAPPASLDPFRSSLTHHPNRD